MKKQFILVVGVILVLFTSCYAPFGYYGYNGSGYYGGTWGSNTMYRPATFAGHGWRFHQSVYGWGNYNLYRWGNPYYQRNCW